MGKHQTSKDSTSHRKHEINISRTDSEIRYDIVTGHWYRLSEGKNGKIKRKRYLTIVGFLVEEGDIEKYLEKEVRRVAKLTPQRYFLTQDTRRIVDEGRVSSFGRLGRRLKINTISEKTVITDEMPKKIFLKMSFSLDRRISIIGRRQKR